MVDPETNSLLLLYDDAQSIYRKKSSLKFTLASVGIQAQGRTTILRLNYRNTREIIEFSYRFAKAYFEQSEDPDIPLVEPEAAGRSGPDPTVKQSGSLALEIDFTLRCLKNWQGKGKSWKDIAILYPGGSAGLKMAEALKASGIPHLLLKSSQNKKLYDDSIDRINIMPIPSSKGLEFDTVVILDASFVPKRDQDSDVLTEDARRLYVGMTRAQQALLISYHRENVLAKAFCMNGGAG